VWAAAGYEIGVALATSNLGRAAARAGRHDEALALLEEAVERFERIGAEGYVDETHARVAECLVLAGRPSDAVSVAEETLARVRREAPLSVPRSSSGRWGAPRSSRGTRALPGTASTRRSARRGSSVRPSRWP
jgi:hypothetical protein